MHPSFFDELNRIWFDKVAADLTEAARAKLPKKDFAVPASKSNTGEKAYPIPDRQHARSALGFAKMHGDSADYARVRAKVEAKFPDMLKSSSSDNVEEKKKKPFFERNPTLGGSSKKKEASDATALVKRVASAAPKEPLLSRLARLSHPMDQAGLGILALPAADQLQAHVRAGLAGTYNKEEVKKRELLPHVAHPLAEVGGLGLISASAALAHGAPH